MIEYLPYCSSPGNPEGEQCKLPLKYVPCYDLPSVTLKGSQTVINKSYYNSRTTFTL